MTVPYIPKTCHQCGVPFLGRSYTTKFCSNQCGQDARFVPKAEKIGARHGRLTIIAPAVAVPGHRHWLCRCDCGREKVIPQQRLRNGYTTSCGCYLIECRKNRKSRLAHGKARTPEYRIWAGMRSRCSNPERRYYHGRGIIVCPEWESFERFLADMGPRPAPKSTLDRIDPNGNYSPSNCRWASLKTQARNTRRNVVYALGGKSKTAAEWFEDPRCIVCYDTFRGRLRRGWPVLKALTNPSRQAPK